MKKMNPLDIFIAFACCALLVLVGVYAAGKTFDGATPAQLTFNMTENTDAAKYVKIGDTVTVEGVDIGDVASVRSLQGGGIAITVNADIVNTDGCLTIDGLVLKLGKKYTFNTKRILGEAVFDAVSEG